LDQINFKNLCILGILPSEQSETGGYTVFTYVCVCLCSSVCTQHLDANIDNGLR